MTPGYQYQLSVSSIEDQATPQNTVLPLTTAPFIATNSWGPAWETSWSSTSEVWPAVIARSPGAGQPVQIFLVGRRNGVAWASLPFDPTSCTAPPCLIPDDTTAPATPLNGPLPRGHRGHLVGNQPIATLQLADFQGTPPVTWQWNNGWAPMADQPPGTVFAAPGGLFSPFTDDAGFKLAVIDTPPAMHYYTRSALIAADSCLIPFDCDDFSRRALYTLLDNVAEIRADHNAALEVEGIVVNQFQPRASLPQQVVKELREEGLPVLATHLSSSVKIKESHAAARPMIHLDASHKLTSEFTMLYEELVAKRSGKKPRASKRK